MSEKTHPMVSQKTYFVIFGLLLVLLVATVGVAYIDLGIFNDVAALTIAVIKATLIMMYFMHVKHSEKLVWMFAGIGFFWLVVMIVLTAGDYLTRSSMPIPAL